MAFLFVSLNYTNGSVKKLERKRNPQSSMNVAIDEKNKIVAFRAREA